jgi:hypothetical protein
LYGVFFFRDTLVDIHRGDSNECLCCSDVRVIDGVFEETMEDE